MENKKQKTMEYKLHSLLLYYSFRIILLIDYLFKVNLFTTLPFLSMAP